MKNLIIIYLALMPAIGWAQDTLNQVFKIQKPATKILAEIGIYCSKGYTDWNFFMNSDGLWLKGCEDCKITGFDLEIKAYRSKKYYDSSRINQKLSGVFHSTSNQLSKDMIRGIKRAKNGSCRFYNIIGITSSGQKIDLNEIIIYFYPEYGKPKMGGIEP